MQKFKKEQVNEKLKKLGWEIPEGINYKGMTENHAVRCRKCGWVQEKRLDNLIYRQEECPMCGNGVFEDSLEGKLADLHEAVNELKLTVLESFTPKEQTQDTDLKALFRKYIGKKGFKLKGRKLMSDEWFELSHELADQLMLEVAGDFREYNRWSEMYVDILEEHPKKQGQDILSGVIPRSKHPQVRDAILKRVVKL